MYQDVVLDEDALNASLERRLISAVLSLTSSDAGDKWTISWDGGQIEVDCAGRARRSRGMRALALMLQHPGQRLPCSLLAGLDWRELAQPRDSKTDRSIWEKFLNNEFKAPDPSASISPDAGEEDVKKHYDLVRQSQEDIRDAIRKAGEPSQTKLGNEIANHLKNSVSSKNYAFVYKSSNPAVTWQFLLKPKPKADG